MRFIADACDKLDQRLLPEVDGAGMEDADRQVRVWQGWQDDHRLDLLDAIGHALDGDRVASDGQMRSMALQAADEQHHHAVGLPAGLIEILCGQFQQQ